MSSTSPSSRSRQTAGDRIVRSWETESGANQGAPVSISQLTPITFLERSAEFFRDTTAVIYEDQRFTYGELRRRVHRLAGALRRAGVQPGDRVAYLAPNTPILLDAHFGVPLAGA